MLLFAPIFAVALSGLFRATKASCNNDNCLNAIIALGRSGSADCASYFLVTVTPATHIVTTTYTHTTSSTTTTKKTTTTTKTMKVTPAAKRHITNRDPLDIRQATHAPTAIPSYASACSGSVKYSSACSCVGAVPKTTTVATPSSTTTVTRFVTLELTTVSIATLTKTLTKTNSLPSCTPGLDVDLPFQGFQRFYVGIGHRAPTNNPASVGATPDITTFPGDLDDCAAVTACLNFGWFSANNDYTYDIHYLISEKVWSCNAYFQGDPNNYFTIADTNVGNAYGYFTT